MIERFNMTMDLNNDTLFGLQKDFCTLNNPIDLTELLREHWLTHNMFVVDMVTWIFYGAMGYFIIEIFNYRFVKGVLKRQLSFQFPGVPAPNTDDIELDPENKKHWLFNLRPKRFDVLYEIAEGFKIYMYLKILSLGFWLLLGDANPVHWLIGLFG